mmetsp:Transcript_1579/g.2090  ORF Transcript_1579/g.2090 Transcript_1579/m.2090 type:complete len:305 (+) Transcript_1579:111-1025(+)
MQQMSSSPNSEHNSHYNIENNTHCDNFPWELNWNNKTHWPESVHEFDIVDYPFGLEQLQAINDRDVMQKKNASLDIQLGTSSPNKKRKEREKSDSDSESSDSSKWTKVDHRKHPNAKLIKKDLQKQQLEHHTWIQHKKLFERQEHLFGKVKDVCWRASFDVFNQNKTNDNNVNNNIPHTNSGQEVGSNHSFAAIPSLVPLPQTDKETVTDLYLGYWCDGVVYQTGHWVAVVEDISGSGTRKLYGIVRYFFRDCNTYCCVCLTPVFPKVEEGSTWTAKSFDIGTADKVVLANSLIEVLKLTRYKH